MKILFHAYNTCCQAESGGVQVRVRKIKSLLEKKGVQVDLFNPYETKLSNYDILHLFMLTEETSELTRIAKLQGLKVVASSITTIYSYSPSVISIIRLLQPFQNKIGFYSNYQNRYNLYHQVDHIISETPEEKRYIQRLYHVDNQNISVVPNGVEVIEETDDKIYKLIGKKCRYVMQVGRADENKNLLNVIKAVKGAEYDLVVVGGRTPIDSGVYFDRCVKEAEGCNNIHFIGWLKSGSRELASAYKNAQAVIMPSYKETFGLVALEAAMAGCNVCLSNTLPILDFNVFDRNFTFDPRNVDEIRKVLDKAMVTPHNELIRRKAIEIFSWESIIEKHIDIYNNLLEDNDRN